MASAPKSTTIISQEANRQHQLLLCHLRWVALGGQLAAILLVHFGLSIPLPLMTMLAISLLVLALNLLCYYRYAARRPIGDLHLLGQLMLDVAAFSALLYTSGGASNPFVSLYLIQVVIAATILRPRHTWLLVALTLGCYIYLSFYSIEIPHLHHYHIGEFFNLHIHGMLIAYALCALLVAYFVMQLSKNLHQRDAALARLRERELTEENILRLGMLAAGAAHELGTPLATISLIAEQYGEDAKGENQQKRSETLRQQVMRCKDILSRITQMAGAARAQSGAHERLDSFLKTTAEDWQKTRPSARLDCRLNGSVPAPVIVAEYALQQTICNLLDNAADASPEAIELHAKWSETELELTISDKGAGISDAILRSLGAPVTSTKPDGMGMGLFLTRAVILRLEGTLTFGQNPGGGARISVMLPLKGFRT